MLNLFTVYFLNLILNTFLSFLTVWGLVELLLFLCRIKTPRIKVLFRLVPFLKIALDPFLYDFSSWGFLQGINPLTAEEGSRTLTASVCYEGFHYCFPVFMKLQMFTKNGSTFTLSDLLFFLYNSPWLKWGVVTVILLTLFKGVFFIIKGRGARQQLKQIIDECSPSWPKVLNSKLDSTLIKYSVSIFQCGKCESPFSFSNGKHYIVLPKTLLQNLSQEEYEAIIGHEMEHIRWRDGLVKQVLTLIRTIFWWIPTQKLCKTLEHTMESACDCGINRYGIDSFALAEGLVKTARLKKEENLPAICYLNSGHTLSYRVHKLIERSKEHTLLVWFQVIVSTVFSVSLLFGKFWIF